MRWAWANSGRWQRAHLGNFSRRSAVALGHSWWTASRTGGDNLPNRLLADDTVKWRRCSQPHTWLLCKAQTRRPRSSVAEYGPRIIRQSLLVVYNRLQVTYRGVIRSSYFEGEYRIYPLDLMPGRRVVVLRQLWPGGRNSRAPRSFRPPPNDGCTTRTVAPI